jgi:hypothetical protein
VGSHDACGRQEHVLVVGAKLGQQRAVLACRDGGQAGQARR